MEKTKVESIEMKNSQHILNLLDLFKKTEPRLAINYIKKHNIDPNYSEQIIADYAAMWLKEPELIKFLKTMVKFGNRPIEHDTVLISAFKNKKYAAAEYLLDNKILDKNVPHIIYVINNLAMDGDVKGLKLLEKYINVLDYKFTNFMVQNNPTVVNIAIEYNQSNLLDYIFNNVKDKNIFFSEETSNLLEMRAKNDFKKEFFFKLIYSLDVKNKNLLFEKDNFEPGDAKVLLKMIEVEVIRQDMDNQLDKGIIKSNSKRKI